MSVKFKLPDSDTLVDQQFFQVPISDGLLAGFQFDAETKTLYAKESQIIIPSQHGLTHISEDPVPDATCDSHGLMPADDKCKLDALLQMRLGILGYQGAGFPDDGGFLVGDIILAAGSEFISIERIGNTVRFTVDSPIPLNCGCESCAQIFWIQDESEPRAIRPPACNGVMPDVSAYGELKIYMLPESTVVDPQDPLPALQEKGKYPVLIFKRYDDGQTPFEAEFELVLKRNQDLTTAVGWSMTPGPTGFANSVWWMGKDTSGKQLKFELWPDSTPGLLGSLLFQGHLLTKQPAVIVDYANTVLSDNKYIIRRWDMKNAKPIGSTFSAFNVWKYNNPENSPTALTNPKKLALDSTINILPLGTIVDIYEFEISRNSTQRITKAFFSKEPTINPKHLWSLGSAIQFGDLFTAREEINNPITNEALSASEINVPDIRLFENTIWGLNSFEDRLILSDDGGEIEESDGSFRREPSGNPINNDIVADIDPTIPGLRVLKQVTLEMGDVNGDGIIDETDMRLFACAFGSQYGDSNYNPAADFNNDGVVDVRDLAIIGQFFPLSVERINDRPVFLWHRENHKNVLVRARIGMPDIDARNFPPYDILLSAPVDSFGDTYLKVVKRGTYTTGVLAGLPYIVVKGARHRDLPQQGILRILTGAFRNVIWRYYFKAAFSSWDDDGITLIGRDTEFPYDEDFPITEFGSECTVPPATQEPDFDRVPDSSVVVELLRQDYTSPAVRLQFDTNFNTGSEAVQLLVVVGMLDMSVRYELENSTTPSDDLVRGFAPGYTVSKVLIQQGHILDGVGDDTQSDPEGFKVYKGGELDIPVTGQVEKWNDLEIMYRDGQVWLWWNTLLIPPDTEASQALPTPVAVNTPYYPINPQLSVGKVALRMFPGAIIRSVEIKDQLEAFSEFTYPGLELTS